MMGNVMFIAIDPKRIAELTYPEQNPCPDPMAKKRHSYDRENIAAGYNNTKVDDILKLKFAWDATNADPRSGQSFQITLPSQLRNRESLTEPMKVTYNGADHTIGECVMDDQTITCTFSDALDTLRGQGFDGLNGRGSALVVAAKATEESTVTIDANGKKTAVRSRSEERRVGKECRSRWSPYH